ncbi:poly-gamma-glutamate synthesis protein (capsule biosynthesis protein) [Paenibacillus phyllosphaerae]|uniref:Poly-gamma-glutamate synthesis protein (Capsule biosynthesis protein) n=1 Tax=Paenibacillus phyllosphaerae TaxID=274593 RepID=A0A7W5AT42_9BACL|nr:CapA family protein [Paenibacillus phyllosphaerae]MBB3108243.1 poly-gamma-glutamate synthesis protein (capsule biosynthesis protein) [Paenibacillus phyllosphaerae]
MSMSRSEAQKLNKERRRKRMRRLLIVNVTLLVLIGVFIGVLLTNNGDQGPPREEAGSGGNSAATTNNGQADTPDAAEDEPDNNPPGEAEPQTGQEEDAGTEVSLPEAGGEAEPDSDSGAKTDVPSGQPAEQPGSSEEEASPPDEDATPAAGEGSADEGETIKLSFVGDILLAGSVEDTMLKNGYAFPYAKSLAFLQGADLTAGNLENPITTRGTPAEDKQYVFKGSPLSLPALKEAGFDVVSLANNHTLDQGTEGLLDTITYLDEAGIPNIGGGSDDKEAFEPIYLEAKGIKVAYIGVSRVLPVGEWKAAENHPGVAEAYDSTRTVKTIKEAKEKADLVIVMIHWGIERADTPEPYQKDLGKVLIDAGADLIIGSHPHVLQGFETYKGKWIAYSLGNYIFNMTKTEKTKDTGVLEAVCTKSGNCKLQFHPMRAAQSQPAPLEGTAAQELLTRLSGFSLNATVDKEGYIKAKE